VNPEDGRIHTDSVSERREPRDDTDAALDVARDLADIAGQLASLKVEVNAWLGDPNYDTLKLKLPLLRPGGGCG
jgi:hypothetical protein